MIKYEIHNQLTGLIEEAKTFEDAKILRTRLREEYIQKLVDPLFQITVLIQNENGSWTQTISDDQGLPVQPKAPDDEMISLIDGDTWVLDATGSINKI